MGIGIIKTTSEGGDMSARIVVTCGSGVGTSKAVANKLSHLLTQRGYDVEVIPTDETNLSEKLKGACVYIPMVEPSEKVDVPGYPFLIGTDEEDALDKLIRILNDATH